MAYPLPPKQGGLPVQADQAIPQREQHEGERCWRAAAATDGLIKEQLTGTGMKYAGICKQLTDMQSTGKVRARCWCIARQLTVERKAREIVFAVVRRCDCALYNGWTVKAE